MPDLPNPFTNLTDAQANRIVTAFSGHTDDQGVSLTPLQAYRRFVRDRVRTHVLAVEARSLDETHNTAKRNALNTLANELPSG